MANPLVSIIIVNWNGREILRKCLNSIRENTTYPNYKVVVVDNGSTDGSVEMIKKEFPYVKLIQNKENLGVAKATNQGIKKIESDYYFLLNNDTEVTRKWLNEFIAISESDSKIGIVGCKLVSPDGRVQHVGQISFRVDIRGRRISNYLQKKTNELREVDSVTGAAFLIKREVIDKIGLFDEGFSPFYYEETDFCVRARRGGFKIMYDPRAIIIHHVGYSMKTVDPPFVFFAREKNMVRFMLLNFPLSWLILRMPHEAKRFVAMLMGRYGKVGQVLPLMGKAWLVNLSHLKEILEKRRNRTMKML